MVAAAEAKIGEKGVAGGCLKGAPGISGWRARRDPGEISGGRWARARRGRRGKEGAGWAAGPV